MLIDVAGHGLFAGGLGPASVVLDLGANEGDFSRAMLSRFGCTVVAVEPSLPHAERLSQVPGLRVKNAAITDTDGWTALHVNENSQASNIRQKAGSGFVDTQQVRTVTLGTLLQEESLPRVDVLKVDIEGSEVELLGNLSDETLQGLAQLTIEFHDFNGTISADEASAIENRLARLGFHRIQLSRTSRENVLFFNPQRCKVSSVEELWARLVTRNIIGLRRMMRRVFAG